MKPQVQRTHEGLFLSQRPGAGPAFTSCLENGLWKHTELYHGGHHTEKTKVKRKSCYTKTPNRPKVQSALQEPSRAKGRPYMVPWPTSMSPSWGCGVGGHAWCRGHRLQGHVHLPIGAVQMEQKLMFPVDVQDLTTCVWNISVAELKYHHVATWLPRTYILYIYNTVIEKQFLPFKRTGNVFWSGRFIRVGYGFNWTIML